MFAFINVSLLSFLVTENSQSDICSRKSFADNDQWEDLMINVPQPNFTSPPAPDTQTTPFWPTMKVGRSLADLLHQHVNMSHAAPGPSAIGFSRNLVDGRFVGRSQTCL